MADIVGSLFGVSPQQAQAEITAPIFNRAQQFAQLDPMQRAQYGLYSGGAMLGQGIGGLLGGEDPRLVQARQMQQVKEWITSNGIDINSPDGLAKAAQYANSIGATEGAMILGNQALQIRKEMTSVNKTEEDYLREKAFREEVAKIPPEQLTEEVLMQLAAKYGTTASVMSAMSSLTGKREAIAAREAAAAEKIATKQAEKEEKTKAANASALAAIMPVMDTIEKSIPLVGMTTAGVGSYLSYLPNTDARTLKANIDTIKANLGFQQLQAMRQASPTGGALGQVAVKELEALQSTIASLDPAQSPDVLKANLKKVRDHYIKWKDTLEKSIGETSSNNAPAKEQWMAAARNAPQNRGVSEAELSAYYDKTYGGR